MALPGTFFPGKNGRTGKHGAFPWKRRSEDCRRLCTGGPAAYHTILSICYIDQYVIYESAAAVLCIK